MPTCIWTNEATDRAVPITLDVPSSTGGAGSPRTAHVLPEHESDVRAYVQRVERGGRLMLAGVLGLSGIMVAVAVGGEVAGWSDRVIAQIAGWLVIAMSGLLVAFPFATPQTVGALGIRASIRLTRALSVVLAAIGVWIALYG